MVYLKMIWQIALAAPALLKLFKTIVDETNAAKIEFKIKDKLKGLDEAIKIKDKRKAAEKFNSVFND